MVKRRPVHRRGPAAVIAAVAEGSQPVPRDGGQGQGRAVAACARAEGAGLEHAPVGAGAGSRDGARAARLRQRSHDRYEPLVSGARGWPANSSHSPQRSAVSLSEARHWSKASKQTHGWFASAVGVGIPTAASQSLRVMGRAGERPSTTAPQRKGRRQHRRPWRGRSWAGWPRPRREQRGCLPWLVDVRKGARRRSGACCLSEWVELAGSPPPGT